MTDGLVFSWVARFVRAIFFSGLRFVLWFGVLVAVWWSAGALLQLPAQSPVSADAIVVLGGDSGTRYAKGRALIEQGYAERLLLINPNMPALRDIAAGVGRLDEVHGETISRSSWDEAVNTLAWMVENDMGHVLVVSDPPHMLRLKYSWASVFRGSGREYTLVAADTPWWSAWRWWDNEQAALFAGIEVLKLGYYVVRYRFGFWLNDVQEE
jgi:uncharacterized SAM-binding protein YcdF (DUF218 family)